MTLSGSNFPDFKGSIVALVTPLNQDKVDLGALQHLVEWHCQSGTQGIVVCGSTGVGNLLTATEREQIIGRAVEAANNKIPIIVGCSATSTADTLSMARQAQQLKADAVLVTAPCYVKPSQEGIFQHFLTLHNSINLPIILYNNPGRVGVDQGLDLICRLAELPRIVSLKDSSNDLSRAAFLRLRIRDDFSLLAGDDPITPAYLAQGGDGTISVVANIAPKLSSQLITAWHGGNLNEFKVVGQKLALLNQAMLSESNPIPIHYALFSLGKIKEELRLPLLPLCPENRLKIDNALRQLGINGN